MEHYFWMATLNYYFWLALAITVNPLYIVFTAILFLVIPSTTKIELIPGLETSMQAQIEILKTQHWLNKQGYYQ